MNQPVSPRPLPERSPERSAVDEAVTERGQGAETTLESLESGGDSSGVRPRRSLSLLETGALSRHPRDGFRRARLWRMSPRTRRTFRALALGLCPRSPDAPRGPGVERYVETSVRLFLSYVPRWMAHGLCLCLYLLEWSPLWSGAGFRRLSRMSVQGRARVLARLGRSHLYPVRRLVLTWSSLCLSAYFDHPEVHRRLNYAPVPFMRSRIDLRRELLARGLPAP
jgi:hypothetical protein